MNNKCAVENLHRRLSVIKTEGGSRGSENNCTAKSWVLFFDDLSKEWQNVFDSHGTPNSDRPDIQASFRSSVEIADLWLEAKPFGSFKSKNKLSSAIEEVLKKLKSLLSVGQTPPIEIVLTDFESVKIWSSEDFLALIAFDVPKNKLVAKINRPHSNLSIDRRNQFISGLTSVFTKYNEMFPARKEHWRPLKLDELINSLVDTTGRFHGTNIKAARKIIKKRRVVKTVFDQWVKSGGATSVNVVDPARKCGKDDSFSELCFHTVLVRFFVIKWFLDHGYLEGTKSGLLWGALDRKSKLQSWKSLLCAEGKSDAEKLLQRVFKSKNVYLWILDCIDRKILKDIRDLFQRYSLEAADADVMGDFYQKYLNKYKKKSQVTLGQYYTPHLLTRVMWAQCNEVLRSKDISLKDPNCYVIDPCVGSGTFLTQGIRMLLDGNWDGARKKYSGMELSNFANRFSGFEINQLSRGIAVVNVLTELLEHSKTGCKGFEQKLKIYETNTYDVGRVSLKVPKFSEYTKSDVKEWKKEILEASTAKKANQYRIVIGNPPWKNPSPALKDDNIKSFFRQSLMPWAWEYDDEKLSDIKGNINGIRDDYAFFMGVALRLLSEKGLMVLVTNESWLVAPGYTLIRKYFLDNLKIHKVLRIGPYFNGVKERAAVVIAEKTEARQSRGQKIDYLDWSDLSNKEWSKKWIHNNLQRLLTGKVARKEWVKVKSTGSNCSIRVSVETPYEPSTNSFVGLEEIFRIVKTGAQSGCGPIFMNLDEEILEDRIRALFSGQKKKHQLLADEILPEIRGDEEKALQYVERHVSLISKHSVKYNRDAYINVMAHFKNKKAKMIGHCYFDPRLWLYPKTDRVDPSYYLFWDIAPKIAFRDMYDPGDKDVISMIDDAGYVIDNHIFNGGVYVASVVDEYGDSNLTPIGEKLRDKFSSDLEFLFFISGIINSNSIQEWAKSNPLERVKIPTEIDLSLARKIAEIEKKKNHWHFRSTKTISASFRKKIKSTDKSLESYLVKLKKAG